jgi:hypothetical protein
MGRHEKGWTMAGRLLGKQHAKERHNAKLLSPLFNFSVLKFHTIESENIVRLFRLIMFISCHLIRKPLCRLQT